MALTTKERRVCAFEKINFLTNVYIILEKENIALFNNLYFKFRIKCNNVLMMNFFAVFLRIFFKALSLKYFNNYKGNDYTCDFDFYIETTIILVLYSYNHHFMYFLMILQNHALLF